MQRSKYNLRDHFVVPRYLLSLPNIDLTKLIVYESVHSHELLEDVLKEDEKSYHQVYDEMRSWFSQLKISEEELDEAFSYLEKHNIVANIDDRWQTYIPSTEMKKRSDIIFPNLPFIFAVTRDAIGLPDMDLEKILLLELIQRDIVFEDWFNFCMTTSEIVKAIKIKETRIPLYIKYFAHHQLVDIWFTPGYRRHVTNYGTLPDDHTKPNIDLFVEQSRDLWETLGMRILKNGCRYKVLLLKDIFDETVPKKHLVRVK